MSFTRFPHTRAWVLCIAILLVAVPLSATSQNQQQLRDASTKAISELRAQIKEPSVIAEVPWLRFNPARAHAYCNQGFLKTAHQLTEQCNSDAMVIFPALARILAPGLAQKINLDPYKEIGATQALEDAATAAGAPITAVNCVLTGLVRATYGDHPGANTVLDSTNAAVDIYQAVGLMQAGAAGARSLGNAAAGSAEMSRLGMLGDDLATAVQNDAFGSIDTAAGPSQTSGWFDRISKAWDSSTTGRWINTTSLSAKAQQQFETCDVDAALQSHQEVLDEIRAWAQNWRVWIELWENDRYCAETGWLAEMGFNPGDGGKHEQQVRAFISALNGIDKEIIEPTWAKQDSLDRKREEAQELRDRFSRLEQLVSALGTTCNIDEALEARRAINESSPCFETLFGSEGTRRLRAIDIRLHDLKLITGDVQSIVGPAVSEAETRISSCLLSTWQEPLQAAIAELNRRNRSDISIAQLQACWPGEWPEKLLAAKAGERDQLLASFSREASTLLESGKTQGLECRFDEALASLDEGVSILQNAGCSIDPRYCSGDTYEPAICNLVIIHDDIQALRPEVDQRRIDFDTEMLRITQVAAELEAWGNEQLELVHQISSARCAAISQIEQIANDLEGLRYPLDCPGELPSAQKGAALRNRVAELQAEFNQRIADLAEGGEQAIKACDPEALQSVVDSLSTLAGAACPPRNDVLSHLQQALEKLRREREETRLILRDAQNDWHQWMQTCDASLLQTTEARQSQLSTCGYEMLDLEGQSRVGFLMWWGESGESLGAMARTADPSLERAESLINSARRQINHGLFSNEEKQATERDLERARVHLGEARQKASSMRSGELIPQACAERVIERITKLEDSMPSMPSTPSPNGNAQLKVELPDLKGRSDRFATTFLEELGLKYALNLETDASQQADPGTVTRQAPPGGMVSKDQVVTIWVAKESEDAPITTAVPATQPAPPVINQQFCSNSWPGSVLRAEFSGGPLRCLCPIGSAWSKVSGSCLSLNPGGRVIQAAADKCRQMPGTLRDSNTGECRCSLGVWDASQWKCIDTAAEDRQRRITEGIHGANCERLYSNIMLHRSDPSPFSQQMAASAEREAQSKGCDTGRIVEANSRGTRARPQPPTGRTGGTTTGGGGTPASPGSNNTQTGEGQNTNSSGARCAIVNMSFTGGASSVGYLVYIYPASQPGEPVAHGVVAVPTMMKQGREIVCRSAHSCLKIVSPQFKAQTDSRVYSSFAAAASVAEQRCKNPVYRR